MNSARLYRCSLVFAALCISTGVSTAGSFSFTGVFGQDEQRALFTFTTPSALVTLRTFGYAGGTNAASSTISSGGFDPILSLFNSTGGLSASSLLVASNDNGACGTVGQDPATLSCFDSYLALTTLFPGNQYTLVLTQADNSANGPDYGSGFSQDGNGNFTAALGCGGPSFCDQTPAQRNGKWAVDITGVGTAVQVGALPEPGSFLLFSTGIAALLLLRRAAKHRQF